MFKEIYLQKWLLLIYVNIVLNQVSKSFKKHLLTNYKTLQKKHSDAYLKPNIRFSIYIFQ